MHILLAYSSRVFITIGHAIVLFIIGRVADSFTFLLKWSTGHRLVVITNTKCEFVGMSGGAIYDLML